MSLKDITKANAKVRVAYRLPRKVKKCFQICPYRKPTQVGECKCTKARERDLSKELGTLAP